MSCHSCHSSPCRCSSCDPENEPLSSALNNFIAAFFGTLQKTCVNGVVEWVLPCDLDSGIPDYPRVSGEGLACYTQRVLASQQDQINTIALEIGLNPDAFVGANYTQPAQGGSVQITTIGANGQGNSNIYNVGDTIYIGDGDDGGYYTVTSIDDSSHITVTSVDNISAALSIITTNTNIYIGNPTKGMTRTERLVVAIDFNSPTLSYESVGLNFVNGLCLGRISHPTAVVLTAVSC